MLNEKKQPEILKKTFLETFKDFKEFLSKVEKHFKESNGDNIEEDIKKLNEYKAPFECSKDGNCYNLNKSPYEKTILYYKFLFKLLFSKKLFYRENPSSQDKETLKELLRKNNSKIYQLYVKALNETQILYEMSYEKGIKKLKSIRKKYLGSKDGAEGRIEIFFKKNLNSDPKEKKKINTLKNYLKESIDVIKRLYFDYNKKFPIEKDLEKFEIKSIITELENRPSRLLEKMIDQEGEASPYQFSFTKAIIECAIQVEERNIETSEISKFVSNIFKDIRSCRRSTLEKHRKELENIEIKYFSGKHKIETFLDKIAKKKMPIEFSKFIREKISFQKKKCQEYLNKERKKLSWPENLYKLSNEINNIINKYNNELNKFCSVMYPILKENYVQNVLLNHQKEYVGKKSKLNNIRKDIIATAKFGLSPENKELLQEINNFMKFSEQKLEDVKKEFQYLQSKHPKSYDFSKTIPNHPGQGSIHPITQTIKKIYNIFYHLGFEIAQGFEIEKEYYNFDALNIPPYHPSRQDHASFYIHSENFEKSKKLLRTQVTPIQIRILEKQKPPISIIATGRCFRNDNMDATHSHTFHQLDGVCIDKNINFSHLKGLLDLFVSKFFKKKLVSRFSPDYFPFTRPSAEYAIQCFLCSNNKEKEQKHCSICKNTNWIEIGGCGLIHPKILQKAGIDPQIHSGYAFGIGIERLAMIAFQITDIRLFYQNNINFLKQF